jgi:hypothetical protein
MLVWGMFLWEMFLWGMIVWGQPPPAVRGAKLRWFLPATQAAPGHSPRA